MKTVPADILIDFSQFRKGEIWFSVWADFEPESDEKFLVISGTVNKDGEYKINKSNKATRKCFYEQILKLLRDKFCTH